MPREILIDHVRGTYEEYEMGEGQCPNCGMLMAARFVNGCLVELLGSCNCTYSNEHDKEPQP